MIDTGFHDITAPTTITITASAIIYAKLFMLHRICARNVGRVWITTRLFHKPPTHREPPSTSSFTVFVWLLHCFLSHATGERLLVVVVVALNFDHTLTHTPAYVHRTEHPSHPSHTPTQNDRNACHASRIRNKIKHDFQLESDARRPMGGRRATCKRIQFNYDGRMRHACNVTTSMPIYLDMYTGGHK